MRAGQTRPSGRRLLRALHRWLGICAALFLLLLCLTGLVLNHAPGLGLDQRFVDQSWLLDRYRISGPDFGPSFEVADRWLTAASGRLYLDDIEIETVLPDGIVGAALVDAEIAIAGTDEILVVDSVGEVVERSPVGYALPGPLQAVAADVAAIWLLSEGLVFRYEPVSARVAGPEDPTGEPNWVRPDELPIQLKSRIEREFRGRGLSLERVIADLHSGRLFGLSGILVMDLSAVALCVLAFSGVLLWIRR